MESPFDNIARRKTCNFIKKLSNFLRTAILKSSCDRLPLKDKKSKTQTTVLSHLLLFAYWLFCIGLSNIYQIQKKQFSHFCMKLFKFVLIYLIGLVFYLIIFVDTSYSARLIWLLRFTNSFANFIDQLMLQCMQLLIFSVFCFSAVLNL